MPSGADDELICTLVVLRPGPFEGQLHVFMEDDGLRETTLTVRGDGRAAGGPK